MSGGTAPDSKMRLLRKPKVQHHLHFFKFHRTLASSFYFYETNVIIFFFTKIIRTEMLFWSEFFSFSTEMAIRSEIFSQFFNVFFPEISKNINDNLRNSISVLMIFVKNKAIKLVW